MTVSDQKGYDDLLAWQGGNPERCFQVLALRQAGAVVHLVQAAGAQMAGGSGNDLATASKAALDSWAKAYPEAAPKSR